MYVLRADAVFDLAMGVLLLAATWTRLYAVLDLPHPTPELFTQIAGALLLAFSYLLWLAPAAALTRPVAVAAAAANALASVTIVVWLLASDLGVGALGTVLLALVALALAVFAVAETLIARGTEA